MQVVVSISLATTGADRTPVAGDAVAEILLISMLLGMCHFSSEIVAQPAEVALFNTQAISKEMRAFITPASRRAQALINLSFITPRNLGRLRYSRRRFSLFLTRRNARSRLLSSDFLQIDEESLVLRRRRIRIERGRRQRVGERPDRFPGVPPMDRESDLPNGFARDFERPHAFGYHRAAFYRTARRRYFDPVAVVDAFLSRQSFGDFDEEFPLQLIERRLMLRPEMKVLGQAVGRTDNRELLFPAVNVHLCLKEFRHRIRRDLRMQRIVNRRFIGFVMLRKRTIIHINRVELA